jgi:hypothetical protein
VIVFVVRARRGRSWRSSVQAAAQKYRLKYMPLAWAISRADQASGTFEGIDLSIRTDSKYLGSGQNSVFMLLEARARFDTQLVVVPRGMLREESDPEVIDYGAAPPAETPSGVPAFDRQVEMYHAADGLRAALAATNDLTVLFASLLPCGLRIEDGRVKIRTKRFPKSPEELIDRLAQMIELCRRLEALQGR